MLIKWQSIKNLKLFKIFKRKCPTCPQNDRSAGIGKIQPVIKARMLLIALKINLILIPF